MSNVEAKLPEAGEYWESTGGVRIRIVGKGLRGFDYVCLYNNGQSIVIEWKITGYNWEHLPGCDSFEWEEPKINTALIAELEQQRIDEATEILTKLESDVAADPWVVQDRESVRTWADEIRWSTWPVGYWEKATHHIENRWHGHIFGCAVLSVRCRQSCIPEPNQLVLHREPRPYEELLSISAYDEACVSLRVPKSGDPVVDDLIRKSVRRDIAVAFASGSLSFSPGYMGRSDWQESQQLADLPNAAVAFADDLMKQLGFSK